VAVGADNPWLSGAAGRAAEYAARMAKLTASGKYMHGEADVVCSLLGPAGGTVLDAGCGTGRVSIELARRGIDVTGVDLDRSMLAEARAVAGSLEWVEGDLADPSLDLGRRYDVVVAAGNVMIFVTPGTEAAVVQTMARHLAPGGRLVAGFQLSRGLALADYDRHCQAAGLSLAERWSTWEQATWSAADDYAVSVHTGPSTRSR